MPQAHGDRIETSFKVKVLAFTLTVVALGVATVLVLAVEGAGWEYLHWARHHPAARAGYDPHHWFARLALLLIAFNACRLIVHVLREPCQTFLTWRRVFLPLPWERHRHA
jgi:hypothetical protein